MANGRIGMANNKRMPKQVATARMEGKGERGRPLKEWNSEVEEDLKNKKLALSVQKQEGL